MDNRYRPLQIIHSFEGLINGTDGIEVMPYGRNKSPELGNFKERVRVQLEKLVERGVGGIVVNIGYDGYLENEEGWKRFITGLEIAVELDLKIWLYDENGFPSGFAGGLVLKGHPELEAAGIKRIIIENPLLPLSMPLPEPEARLFALFGISNGQRVKILVEKWASEVNINTGSYDSLEIYFVAPLRAGTLAAYPENPCSQYINLLDRRAVMRFVSLTHLKYFKEVPTHLWKHIEAIFTDEPLLLAYYAYYDNMDKNLPLYPAMPWCQEMEEVFYKNNGYFIEDRINSLFEGMSVDDKKTRRQFWQTVAEIYEDSFSQISDVCSAINIDLTGHLFDEDQLYRNVVAQGNPINVLKHFQKPGIDILTSNPDMLAPIFTFALKMVLSAAMFGGKKGLMTEVSEYGEYWTPEKRKKLAETAEYWIDERNANSIEDIKYTIAFLFLFGIRDYAFYYAWRNFTAAEYRELTDFTSLLCSCGKESIYRPDYALYYPIERMWEEYLPSEKDWRYKGYESQSERLKKIDAVMSTLTPGATDICKELFFSNVQYILCDRSNLYNLVKMKIKRLLFPPIGEPAQELADLCRTAGIEIIRLDGRGAESLRSEQPMSESNRNLQTGAKVVYACYDRFIFVLNTSKEPSFLEMHGDYEALFPSRNDKKIKVSGRREINPLESLFLFPKKKGISTAPQSLPTAAGFPSSELIPAIRRSLSKGRMKRRDKMTVRERFQAVMNFRPFDRLPVIEFARLWDKTFQRWCSEGLPFNDFIAEQYDICEYFGLDVWKVDYFSAYPRDNSLLRQVTNEREYDIYKQYLFPAPESIIDEEKWKRWAKEQQSGKIVIYFALEGFFYFSRGLFGIEPQLYAFYDKPELMHRINADLTQWMIEFTDRLCSICIPDWMMLSEDMSYKNGPMLSKEHFDIFLKPYYEKVIPHLRKYGIITFADSDGEISALTRWLREAGFQGIAPLEHQAGTDIQSLRKDNPDMRFIGNFDKLVMNKGENALRKEFERLLPSAAKGGFCINCDHQTPPGVSLNDYKLYIKLFREYAEIAGKMSQSVSGKEW